jgi:hypothetical protein
MGNRDHKKALGEPVYKVCIRYLCQWALDCCLTKELQALDTAEQSRYQASPSANHSTFPGLFVILSVMQTLGISMH